MRAVTGPWVSYLLVITAYLTKLHYSWAEMQAANLMLEVKSREDDLAAAKQRCDSLEKYMEEVLAQNEQFRLQVSLC